MTFSEPLWFLLALALPLLFFVRKRGYLGFSDSSLLGDSPRWLRILTKLPMIFMVSALVFMIVALARPQIPGEPENRTIPGRDIILAVDISFSMSFPFKGELVEHETPPEFDFQVPVEERRRVNRGLVYDKPEEGWQRIHAAQRALMKFIENRHKGDSGDRIGLVLFDVVPRYGWPITDDLRMLYRKAQFIQENLGTGTNFGGRPPGPIDLAVKHFDEYGEAQSQVLIMVTDGEDNIDYATQRRLSTLVRENGIRFYLVGIGETLANKDVDIIKFADSVGGHVFRVEDTESLNQVFATIDRLEKSEVTTSQLETRDDVFFYFAWLALGSLGLFFFSNAIILRR